MYALFEVRVVVSVVPFDPRALSMPGRGSGVDRRRWTERERKGVAERAGAPLRRRYREILGRLARELALTPEVPDPRERGPAHRRQHRQAPGVFGR